MQSLPRLTAQRVTCDRRVCVDDVVVRAVVFQWNEIKNGP